MKQQAIFVTLFTLFPLCLQGKPSIKNVLFIVIDDLRPILGCYNDCYAITPNIDDLANKGILFENAYCQQAVSGPSRASMLTGMRPDEIGVTDLNTHFRKKHPDITTLPQLFKKNGYEAIGIGKIYHGSPQTQDSVSWSSLPCGLQPMHPLSGQSLRFLIEGKRNWKDRAFSQFPRPYKAVNSSKNQTHMGYTVRTNQWRYTLWYNNKTDQITDRELYYINDSKTEKTNVSGQPDYIYIEEELQQMIEDYKNYPNQ